MTPIQPQSCEDGPNDRLAIATVPAPEANGASWRAREVNWKPFPKVGMKPSHIVHWVYRHSMINGGYYVREAVTRFTSTTCMSAGTGIETRSAAQVTLMADVGATVILGFSDDIKKLGEVARAEGLVPCKDINIRTISGQFCREDKKAITKFWGVRAAMIGMSSAISV
jgi:phenylacetate-coenzyme A ligase PaaK-like adenylate-forming protein